MIYTKIEIAPGVELKIEVDPDEMYSVCPTCGLEHRLDYEVIEELKGDWTGSTTCGKQECADRLKEKIANGEFD